MGIFRKNPLICYFFLTFFFSWSVGIPLALSTAKIIPPLPLWLHYFTAYGPFFFALTVQFLVQGGKGTKDLLAGLFNFKIKPIWYILAFSPLILFLISALIKPVDLSLLGQINFLPNLGFFALVFWILNSGIGEEVGWRGFALPRLQKGRSALSATLILSVFWIAWHLPAFFYLPNYIKFGFSIFPFFALSVAIGAIVYTFLYNSTKGSLFIVILFHGVFNYVTASKAGEGLPAAIISTVVIVWGILVLILFKSQTLSPLKTNNQ